MAKQFGPQSYVDSYCNDTKRYVMVRRTDAEEFSRAVTNLLNDGYHLVPNSSGVGWIPESTNVKGGFFYYQALIKERGGA